MLPHISLEIFLLIGSGLIVFSILLSKLFDNLGLPTLLIFLVVGVLAGQSGLHLPEIAWARSIGIVAMIFILFSGGLETDWREVKPVLKQAFSLSTLGIVLTSVTCGFLSWKYLNLPLEVSFLIGAIISSTDAAAVFSILRSRQLNLKPGIKPLLELESGTNDPMAIFLTIAMIELIKNSELAWWNFIWMFFKQATVGAALGFLAGWGIKELINRLRFSYEGIVSVFTLAMVFFTYALTDRLGGSGFLAVYIAGIMMGNSAIIQKKTLTRFWDAQAWLSQIVMFLTLGLFLKVEILREVWIPGLLLSAFLILLARPLAVFVSLGLSRLDINRKVFISWVGVRGAVPIILATFPLTDKLPQAELIFHLVFFVVLTSAFFQGWSLPIVAKFLNLLDKQSHHSKSPIEFQGVKDWNGEIIDYIVPFSSPVVGKAVVKLTLPKDTLILLICREGKYLVPKGSTTLKELDILTLLQDKSHADEVSRIFSPEPTP